MSNFDVINCLIKVKKSPCDCLFPQFFMICFFPDAAKGYRFGIVYSLGSRRSEGG